MNIRITAFILSIGAALVACNNEREDLTSEVSIPVSVKEVGVGSIEQYITTTGTVNPVQEVELKAEISGDYSLKINPRTRKPFALGDRINKGEVLVSIEDAEYRNNLNLEGKKLNLEISSETLAKQQALFEKGGVSQLDLRNAEIDKVNAENTFQNGVISLSKMRITAPFTGIIVDLPHTTGGIKIETGTSVVKIMNYEKLFMDAKFPEKNLGDIKQGMEVRVTHYTMKEDTIYGRIAAISPAIDAETRTFKSTLELGNSNLKFRPGMFIKADLVIASKDSAIVIPKDVILSRQRGSTVFVVERGEARERVIELGMENPYEVEVISGLKLNDRLVTEGFETLTNRSKVTIVK